MIVTVKRFTRTSTFRIGCVVIGVLLLTIVGYFFAKNSINARADTIDWSVGDPTVTLDSDRDGVEPSHASILDECVNQQVFIGNDTTPYDACVFQARSFRFGVVTKCVPLWYGGCTNQQSYAIGLDRNDSKMYTFNTTTGIDTYSWRVSSDIDTIMYAYGGGDPITVLPDVPSHLTKSIDNNGSVVYTYDSSADKFYSPDTDTGWMPGSPRPWGTTAMSRDGKWAVAEYPYVGIIRIDLTNNIYKIITSYDGVWNYGYNPSFDLTISNDGKHVAITGNNIQTQVIEADAVCGDQSSIPLSSWLNHTFTNCPTKNLDEYIAAAANNGSSRVVSTRSPKFSDDGGLLEIFAETANGNTNYTDHWYTLGVSNYVTPPRLDYLALGDSYSSGEGDYQSYSIGNTHYLAGTDVEGSSAVPQEKCHVSDRSYPFMLASSNMHLQATQWHTVACSGARTVDIAGYDAPSFDDLTHTIYLGQSLGDNNQTPRLKAFLGLVNTLQTQAAQDFIPGRVQQVKFVKESEPKVVTLTVGGNDVNFSKILTSCVESIPLPSTPCHWTQPQGLRDLGSLIKGEYSKLVSTYAALKQASPSTKIYVLGYPQFVGNYACPTNVALDTSERTMIGNGVTYMNQVIKAAASAAGVYYVDIEDALGQHTLCGLNPDKYVSGLVDGIGTGSNFSGAYHPNAKGQGAIAQKIEDALGSQTLKTFDDCDNDVIICPDSGSSSLPTSTYFTPPSTYERIVAFVNQVKNTAGEVLASVEKGAQAIVDFAPEVANPNSLTIVTMHSDPIDLGSYTTNADGSLSAEITIPSDIAAGYHTIDIQGTSASGVAFDNVQVILIKGTNTNDINDNGIDDSLDKCLFVAPLNVDVDMDGIDDACDPDISSTPQLYRVRQGDSNRLYNGIPENSNYLYIERNTRASSLTGVTGDYDPDGDGWAIVGASQGHIYSNTSVPDTAPAANFEVEGSGSSAKPIVYIRAGGYGCVAYTPTSLSKVLSTQSRTIKIDAENTNQCREADPAADEDGNGQPDNTQSLYVARAGDADIQHTRPDNSVFNEDPSKTYLFRNFYAAEAQLGISDFSPTGTAAGNSSQPIQQWNLLASSQDSTMPGYNELVIINDPNSDPIPTILTKKQNGQCVAYQPTSTDLIKMGTQYTRGFTKLSALPSGIMCD